MKLRSILFAGVVGVGVLGVFGFNAGVASLSSPAVENIESVFEQGPAPDKGGSAVEFAVDPTNSSVAFWIEHRRVSKFYGRFSKVSGTFTVNPENGVLSTVKIEIPAESIDTNSAGRDRHLKGADFFDAKQFQTLSFVSTEVEHKAGDFWNATGEFLMHGVTKTITVEIEVTGRGIKGQKGYLGGIAAEFVIKRSDFGMHHSIESGGIGDAVTIMVGLQGRGE